jgi:class 3 adenylate cyclase
MQLGGAAPLTVTPSQPDSRDSGGSIGDHQPGSSALVLGKPCMAEPGQAGQQVRTERTGESTSSMGMTATQSTKSTRGTNYAAQSMDPGTASQTNRRKAVIHTKGEEKQLRKVPWDDLYRHYKKVMRCVADSKSFNLLTILLTVYALTGDDIRLLCSNQPQDAIFNGITILCIVVFLLEIVICTFGRDDYFLSFFFWLDCISTVTLLLDLTYVSELIHQDDEEVDNVRTSRSAKIGARAGRMVKVVRLVRILKLYKAIYEARRARQKRERRGNDPGEEDDWDDIDVTDPSIKNLPGESRVGKKLSDLTIRRVICLVLLMMLVLPVLRIDASEQFPTSATYGADIIHESFFGMLEKINEGADASTLDQMRTDYEHSVLQYVFYHNWFESRRPKCLYERQCARDYDSHVVWIGIAASSEEVLYQYVNYTTVRKSTVDAFLAAKNARESTSDSAWIYNYGSMPGQVQARLGEPWQERCDTANEKYVRLGIPMLYEVMEDWGVTYAVECPEDLRFSERKKYAPRLNITSAEFSTWHFAFYYDIRPYVMQESWFSLGITLFVCLALCSAAVFFSNDANRLVLYPVENMIAKVETIRDNPLMAMKVADREFRLEEKTRQERLRKEQNKYAWLYDAICCTSKASAGELMETVILEKTIIKLGSLLALGFGEAGVNIIEHNMHGVDSASVDAMVKGTRVECIIGVTRIRDFSTATEVLQAKVMTFVNQIAEIVHGVVDEFHGAANKNNGDIFLMIWRTSELEEAKVRKLADMSMLAFTRILAAVHRSPVLAEYRGHPGLQQRNVTRVHLSTGLHYGWAIEGAVGSEFKIDASYLSPHMSISESVERATNIYNVSILVAESVKTICTPAVAAKLRLIDRVIIIGSVDPMELYAIDLDYKNLTVERLPPLKTFFSSRVRFKVRQYLEQEKMMKLHEEVYMANLFNQDPDIATMRFRYTLEFIHVFNMGYQNYLWGEWQVAQRLLSRTWTMLGAEDGPSAALLRFMEAHEFKAPEDWKGYRELGHAVLT